MFQSYGENDLIKYLEELVFANCHQSSEGRKQQI